MLLLSSYYMINQDENSQSVEEFKNFLKEYNIENRIILYMLQILNIIMKGSTEINNIINNNKENNDCQKVNNDKKNNNCNSDKLSQINQEYIILFLKIILSLIEEKQGTNNNILEIINGGNINLFYKNLKDILLRLLKIKNTQLFKNIFSYENHICLDLFYFKLFCSDSKEKPSIKKDLLYFCQELITYHNYPFIFKLMELINENAINKNKDFHVEKIITSDPKISFEKTGTNNEDNEEDISNIVIFLIESIYDILKEYKLDLNDRKRNKYYIRGILNLLITIHNICEMKENIYYKNRSFRGTFVNLVKLIDQLNLIYSFYSIKIDHFRGKLISEIIFDSFLYLIMTVYDKEINELFFKIFLKENKKENKYVSIFYLMNLIIIYNNEKDTRYKNELENYIDLLKIKKMNSLLRTKKNYNLNNIETYKSLPNYKCVIPIKNINFSIYFLCKTGIFLYYKLIINKDFQNKLLDTFIAILNRNILNYKEKRKNPYNEEAKNTFKLYQKIKEYYEDKPYYSLKDLDSLREWLLEVLPCKLKSQYDIKLYYSSFFALKDMESHVNTNDEDSLDLVKKNPFNISCSLISIDDINNIMDENKQRTSLNHDKKNKKNDSSNKINERQKKLHEETFFTLDDVRNKCFIYNPKNLFIKRIFSHIYYKLIFYDKAFMYIKNKYLRQFKKANINTKQLNFPSKVKNFSNFFEPKLFLRKDFNFFDETYFRISHDFLYRNVYNIKEIIDKTKEKETKSLLQEKLSLVKFYEHSFNIDYILKEKDKYFDCELVTPQYVYYGYIIFSQEYIYFQTKDFPDLYDRNKKLDFNVELFYDLCLTIRNGDNITDKKKKLILFITDIKLIIKRRILLMYQSLEIFCHNGKSYFFNLFKKEKCNLVFKILNEVRDRLNEKDKFEIINDNIVEKVKNINNDVKNRIIDNYLYLSKINFYSSRTFNDVGQYPIFPWIILDFEKLDNLLRKLKKEIGKNDYIPNNLEKQTCITNEDLDSEIKNEYDVYKLNEILNSECGLRIFNYPLSMQRDKTRAISLKKYRDEVEEEGIHKFIYHHGAHYSNSSYVYFFLMRNNPYSQCLIKLQNYTKENPNRLFISFYDTLNVFKTLPENRELIPDLFCHFDFFSNLNCVYNGYKTSNNVIVDDIYDNKKEGKYLENMNSIYLGYIYLFRKLINSNLISKFLPLWLDNIFGKNQLPDNQKKRELSCNIFHKYTYEDNIQLDNKLSKYREKFIKKEIDKNNLAEKIMIKIDLINNFGVTPHRILENTIKLKTSTEFNNNSSISLKINRNIFFINYNELILILFNDDKQPNKIKKITAVNYNNLYKDKKNENLFKKTLYPCGYLKQLKKKLFIDNMNRQHKIPIFKPCYSMSSFTLFNKLFILTCRYLGNIFKIQNNEYYIDILCEDFVTCIVSRENKESVYDNIIIYTGLKNGKLIEWNIKPKLNDFKKISIFEKKNCHCHKGEITCVELYQNQNIIITGGIDKMIFVRKTYDFELLTVINLLYSYGNPIVGEKLNIVPTLIKVSELNCIYIMLYNYETEKSYIRGYNLNGLFFAQSKENDYINICFTKNGSLLTSYYNQKVIEILKCSNLELIIDFQLSIDDFLNNKNKKTKGVSNNIFLVWFNYNYKNKEFILLLEDQIIKSSVENLDKQKDLEYY